jgi:uncharacterized membrane protein YbhN (UPF0104 family)
VARRYWPHALIIAFAAWCAVSLHADIGQLSFAPVWQARTAVLCTALLSLLNYLLRGVRWLLYLRALGARVGSGYGLLTYWAGFAFTLSPAKLGELVRARYYMTAGVPLSATAAAYFVERLLDLVVVLLLALVTYSAASGYALLLWATVLAAGGGLVAVAYLPWPAIAAWGERHTVLPGVAGRLLGPILNTLLAARVLLRPGLLLPSFVLGLLAWAAEGAGLGLLGALAPEVELDWVSATGIYSVAIIVGALSFLPGGLGSTEAVMVVLLSAHGHSTSDALLITLVCRLLTLWLAVAIGWLAVLALPSLGGRTVAGDAPAGEVVAGDPRT